MLPMPATNFWSMSKVLRAVGRSASSCPKRDQLMTSSSGSNPRCASSGTWEVSSSVVVTNISPKVRGSTKRSWPPWVKVMITWVCLSTGSLGPFARSSWPLMPRCTTSTSSTSRPTRRYLPARRIDPTRLPSSRARNSVPLLWRRIDRFPFTSTVLIRLLTISLSRSRRMVSTSGSSGTAPHPPFGARHDGALGHGLVPRGDSGVRLGALGDRRPGDPGGGLLGVLLGPPLPHAALGARHEHPGSLPAGVVRSRPLDLVVGQLTDAAQHDLLQTRLEVLGAGSGRRQLDAVVEDVEHH